MGGGGTGAGWHPDPSGRGHSRYWDGEVWTDQVSTWGQTWVDPPGPNPAVTDVSMLAEPGLVFVYGTSGIESTGRWPVLDATGTHRGNLVIETGFDGKPGRYFLCDLADRLVVTVAIQLDFSFDFDVVDWQGRRHGVFDCSFTSTKVRFMVGGQVLGHASTADGASRILPGRRDEPSSVELTDPSGASFATVTNHEERGWLRSFYGWETNAVTADPDDCCLQLERSVGLPEPLRTMALAFPLLYVQQVLSDRRIRRNNRT